MMTVTLKALRAVALCSMVLSGILHAQVWKDWSPTSTNTELEYRWQALPNMRQCYLEFRDKHQGKGNTTFDVGVDYKSTALDQKGAPMIKTDTEHIVTTSMSVGTARVTECLAVSEVRASVAQRH